MFRAFESFHGRDRTAGETELAVIIVLNDERAALSGPTQQVKLAIQSQRGPERELVSWREVNGSRLRAFRSPAVDVDAMLIHRDRNDFRAGQPECVHRAGVAWIFHPHLVAR